MPVSRFAGPLAHPALLGLVNSMLQLIQAFGHPFTPEQDAAITGLVNALYVTTLAFLAPPPAD